MLAGTVLLGEYSTGLNGPLNPKSLAQSGRLSLISSVASKGHETPSRGGVFRCWTLENIETARIESNRIESRRRMKVFKHMQASEIGIRRKKVDASTPSKSVYGSPNTTPVIMIVLYSPTGSNDLLRNRVNLLVSCIIFLETILTTKVIA